MNNSFILQAHKMAEQSRFIENQDLKLEDIDLSEHSIHKILRGFNYIHDVIVQVTKIQKMNYGRYHISISDGGHLYSMVMLNGAHGDNLELFSIIEVRSLTLKVTGDNNDKIIYLNEINLLISGNKIGKQIGNPQKLTGQEDIFSHLPIAWHGNLIIGKDFILDIDIIPGLNEMPPPENGIPTKQARRRSIRQTTRNK